MNTINEMLGEKHCVQHSEPQDYEDKLLIIKPEKLKKAQEKEINLIAVPLCGMKRVYERMYEGILNIEDGAE